MYQRIHNIRDSLVEELKLPSIFSKTLLTAPAQPWHDIVTLRTTVYNHNEIISDWKSRELKNKINK
jgi:hypothetical protein